MATKAKKTGKASNEELPVEDTGPKDATLKQKQTGLLAAIVYLDRTTQRSPKQAVLMAHEITKLSAGEEDIAIGAARLIAKEPDGMSPVDAVHIAHKLRRLAGELEPSDSVDLRALI